MKVSNEVKCPNCGALDSLYVEENRSTTVIRIEDDVCIVSRGDTILDGWELKCAECTNDTGLYYKWED